MTKFQIRKTFDILCCISTVKDRVSTRSAIATGAIYTQM